MKHLRRTDHSRGFDKKYTWGGGNGHSVGPPTLRSVGEWSFGWPPQIEGLKRMVEGMGIRLPPSSLRGSPIHGNHMRIGKARHTLVKLMGGGGNGHSVGPPPPPRVVKRHSVAPPRPEGGKQPPGVMLSCFKGRPPPNNRVYSRMPAYTRVYPRTLARHFSTLFLMSKKQAHKLQNGSLGDPKNTTKKIKMKSGMESGKDCKKH